MRRFVVAVVGLLGLVATYRQAWAVQVTALDPLRDWKLRTLRFDGVHAIKEKELVAAMSTRPRTWFAIWRPLPAFDPVAFETDLKRLAAIYRAHGYYHARIEHDVELPAEGDDVTVVVYVDEGPVVHVTEITLAVADGPLPGDEEAKLRAGLPLEVGDDFGEQDYERSRAYLRTAFRQRGYARVAVTKSARVDVRDDTAAVEYRIERGPSCTFGTVQVTGLTDVQEKVVRREVQWQAGQPFRETPLDETRKRLEELRLFRSVQLVEDDSKDPVVNVDIQLAEAPQREVRLGIGYDTYEQVRGIAAWRDYNFHGGARQLGFTARASFLRRTGAIDFLQPHFPTLGSRVRLIFALEQFDEDTYTLNQTKVVPRLEWDVLPRVSLFGFYRAELDLLHDVEPAVRRAARDATPKQSVISGFGFGVDWNATDDLIDPTRGWTLSAVVEPVGNVLGGDVGFLRLIGESRGYLPLPWKFVGAARLRAGTSDPWGGSTTLPIFERFYAGGINSVRGYARRRVGPLADDEPIGGLSVFESSVELRHPITDTIGIAGFFDGGQVGRDFADFPLDDLQYGTGLGARYRSPIGPVRVDLGFPLDRRGDDAAWQVYLSVGQTF